MGNEITIENQNQSISLAEQPHMRLIEIAVSKGADIVQLERLMDLQERYEAAQSKKLFNEAMSQFQSALPVIEKKGVVDYTSAKGRTFYQYAKLEDIAQAIRPALKQSGLSYRFNQQQDGNFIKVTCTVTHKSGHSESSSLTGTPDLSGGKDQMKALASTVSYLRRYTLTGLLGIVVGGEDDDAGGYNDATANCYPDDDFKKSFPNWERAILNGKKTPDQIVEAGNKQGITFSENQLQAIYNTGKA